MSDTIDLAADLVAEGVTLIPVSPVPGSETVISALIKFAATKVHKIRFRRFMNSIALEMKQGRDLDQKDREQFFEWVNESEHNLGYFHDSMRKSLHTNSKLSQIIIGLLVAESYNQHNISYETSILYRAFDGLDDFEIEIFNGYLEVYTTQLKKGEMFVITESNIRILAGKRMEDYEQTKSHLIGTVEVLASRRIFERTGAFAWADYNHLQTAPISDLTFKAIDLIKRAIDLKGTL